MIDAQGVPSDAGRESEPADESPELSVRVVSMLLHQFRRTLGDERLQAFWARERIALPISHFEDHSNYVSLRFTEDLTTRLVEESGDPDFVRNAAMRAATPESLGFMFHMLKAFATPRQSYLNLIRLGPTFNRVGAFTIEELSNDRMTLAYRTSVPERNRNFCIGRMAQFASLPTIWNLPPAEVRELVCQVNGGDACRYVLKWHNPIRGWRKYAGAAVGFAGGAAMSAAGYAEFAVAAPALMFGGGFAGALFDSRTELRRLQENLSGQNEGLAKSLEELQRRSDEVFRANVELEKRVEQRTHELSDANSRLSVALDRAHEVDRLKTQFFDNVSHELRTPLTLILLTLESLQQTADTLPTSLRQHLERMEKSASRLLRLINDLLDLAKIEAGKMRLRYDPVDLKQLLSGVLIPFRVLAEGKGIQLRLDIPEPVEEINADPEKLDLVFQNLVSNALKFTQEGEVVLRVTQDEGFAHITVTDTGAGMAESDLPIIFDRFSQADSSGTRRFGGTGIGLALVKETVELHGGLVSVESELGKGSTFRISLPRGSSHIREDIRERRRADVPVRNERRLEQLAIFGRRDMRTGKLINNGSAGEEIPPPPETLPTPTRPRILLVEDDVEIRSHLRTFLRNSYELVEAADGAQGLKLAVETHPALIVSDVMMPVMSGMQMLERLRSLPETVDIPVILLTARSEVESRVQGISAGASDYIGKPFSPRELVARVEAQLRLRDAAARLAQSERLAATSLLTSGFAHEVRNPLNALVNALAPLKECLTTSGDASLALQMVDVAEEAVKRIQHLAESLLAMVRSHSTPVTVRLKDSIDAASRAVRWKVPRDVSLEFTVETPDPVYGDPASLTQVWVNLLDNALRAVSPGGSVQVSVRREGRHVVVAVKDDGVGIAPADMTRLFEPFFSTRSAGEGTGLGLALSRRIIVHHGGSIAIESEPGAGTTVTVRLPAYDAGASAVSDGERERGSPVA